MTPANYVPVFNNIEQLNGGNGPDTFSLNNGARLTGYIDGGAGVNKLDLLEVPAALVTPANATDGDVTTATNAPILNTGGFQMHGYFNITDIRVLVPGPTVTAVLSAGTLTLTGLPTDDVITVKANGAGSVSVSTNTSVNSLLSPQFFVGVTALVLNSLGGADNVTIDSKLTFSSVTVDLGDDDDRLVLGADPNDPVNNNTANPAFGTNGKLTVGRRPLSVVGGLGSDTVFERSTIVGGLKQISLGAGNNKYNLYACTSNDTSFTSDTGNDNLFVGYLTANGRSIYETGAGNDLITAFASRFKQDATFNTAVGFDTVGLDANRYDQNLVVITGNDADFLLFARSIATAMVDLNTGSGADQVELGRYLSGYSARNTAVHQRRLDSGAVSI